MSDAGEIRYDVDFDFTQIVNEMARRIAKERDQRVLDLLEHAYGFVCPVRCRDCEHYEDYAGCCQRRYQPMAVTPDGFCAWGERRCDA